MFFTTERYLHSLENRDGATESLGDRVFGNNLANKLEIVLLLQNARKLMRAELDFGVVVCGRLRHIFLLAIRVPILDLDNEVSSNSHELLHAFEGQLNALIAPVEVDPLCNTHTCHRIKRGLSANRWERRNERLACLQCRPRR